MSDRRCKNCKEYEEPTDVRSKTGYCTARGRNPMRAKYGGIVWTVRTPTHENNKCDRFFPKPSGGSDE